MKKGPGLHAHLCNHSARSLRSKGVRSRSAGFEVQGLVAEAQAPNYPESSWRSVKAIQTRNTLVLLVSVVCIVSCWRVFALTVELGPAGLTDVHSQERDL